MRLFTALKVPALSINTDQERKLLTGLEKHRCEYRVVPKDHLYIPLVELGDLGRGSFLRVYEDLKSLQERVPPFTLKLSGVWAYPEQHHADLLWVGVQNSREIRFLQQEMADVLNIPVESFSKPHIPLVWLDKTKDVRDIISPFKRAEFRPILIDEIRILEHLPDGKGIRMVGSHQLYDPGLSISV